MARVKKYERKEKKDSVSSDLPAKISSLIPDLRSEDGVVRETARKTLEFIGRQAVTPLLQLLKDPDDQVRWEAAKALTEIADPRAVSGLVATLDDHNFGVRWLAAGGLIAIGRDALAPLVEALTQRPESAWLRQSAHHVLHDLANKDLEVKDLVAPVIAALEGIEPEIGVVDPAYAALKKLKRSISPAR
jgi:HEAT repeat protein